MKKILTLALASVLASSAYADPIDLTKAKNLASPFMSTQFAVPQLVKTAERDNIKKRNLAPAVQATSPYYIFSRGEGQGFVIVSGDDCMPEILGYAEQGDYDEANLPPALAAMLDQWKVAIETAQEEGTNVSQAHKRNMMKAAANRESIAPLTTSHWHQSGPYNDYAPLRVDNGAKSMTGCVATAISQILYYWRKDLPSTLQATTPTYNHDGYSHADVTLSFPKGTPLKWDLMRDSYSSEPAEYKEAVATLVYAIGTASHLEYSIEGGTATSGHIEDIPNAIKNFFGMNGGWVAYRSSYSQEAWTQLIYDELKKGRPVMYTGVHESSGGHAVYIDGYQKGTDLMHFNFGWGGQGDGYFTTTLETGMNMFNGYQSALINAYPKTWNMNVDIDLPAHVYANTDNQFRIKIDNNSTLNFSGVYLFASSTDSKPTNLSSAKSSDTETLIATGSAGTVTLSAKPTSVKKWYFTVTDENLTVLAKREIDVEASTADISVKEINVLGSNVTEEINGRNYMKIFSNKALVELKVNNASAVPFGGTARISLYSSTDGGQTFEFDKSITKANCDVLGNAESVVQLSISSLSTNKLYYAVIEEGWGSLKPYLDIKSDVAPVYFYATGESDLASTLDKDTKTLVFTGHWDASTFASMCGSKGNTGALAYDITAVENVLNVPEVEYPNPNALIFASKGAKGTNVIVEDGGVSTASCISLIAGYPFCPRTDIVADEAKLNINLSAANWGIVTVPFNCKVSDGILAREIMSHKDTSTGINNATENVTRLEAGKLYLVHASSDRKQELAGEATSGAITVVAKPSADVLDPAFIGTFNTTTAPAGAKLIAADDYFRTVDEGTEVGGLRGYFLSSVADCKDFRAYSNLTLDPRYEDLIAAIQQLYKTYDEFSSIVTDEANAKMLATIAESESDYSLQSAATSTDVKKKIEAINAFIEEYKMMIDNVGNSVVDMTAMIENPSFEASAATIKGWTADVATSAKIRKNAILAYKTVHGDGSNFMYVSDGSKVSQTIQGLKPGYYRISAMLGSEPGNSITLFAADKVATVEAHSFGIHYLTEAVIDEILVGENGELTIGVYADNWYNADSFKLVFTANSEETGIIPVASEANSVTAEGTYTIQGVKVNRPTVPGLYIINGKKVLIE